MDKASAVKLMDAINAGWTWMAANLYQDRPTRTYMVHVKELYSGETRIVTTMDEARDLYADHWAH